MSVRRPSEQDTGMLLALLTGQGPSSPEISWPGVFAAAERHRLLLPLRNQLEKRSDLEVPAGIQRELDHAYVAWAVKRKAYLETLRFIGETATENGVSLILLKGPHIADRLYRPPQVRLFRDLDLMVEATSFELLTNRLAEAGFQRAPSSYAGLPVAVLCRWELPLTLIHRDAPGLQVDLHMNITHRLEPYRLTPEGIWENAAVWDDGLLCLSDEDFLLFLFIHSLKHGYFSLLAFLDLHLAAQDPLLSERFGRVLEHARRQGFGSLIRVSAELGRRLLGTTWPDCGPAVRRERLAVRLLEPRVRLGLPWISERFQLLLSAGLLVDSGHRLGRYWKSSLFRPPATIPPQRYAASPWSNPWASTIRLIRRMRRN